MTVAELIPQWSQLWAPPETLSLSAWAESHLCLSSEYSARSGPISLYGFQRGILDAFTDDRTEQIVCMMSTQMFKTLMQQIIVAYCIAEQPAPILIVQPTDTDAKTFSKERLEPMIRDNPFLKSIVAESGAGHEGTILQKQFPGGSVSLVGSQAPGNLARRSIRVLLLDELDKYPDSAGKEGDPTKLAIERTATFGSRRKIVMCCSPTTENSRIARAYEDTDQRQPWVPCPVCGVFQVLQFRATNESAGCVWWDNTLPTVEQRAASARYQCANIDCNAKWNDLQRWDTCKLVQWRSRKPFAGKAGFHISHLYSPFKKLSEIVENFISAKDNNRIQDLKVFINTNLAETWKESGQVPDETLLYARRESYPFGLEDAVIPARALFLTCGVDVQDDRLEYEIVGWGKGKESWSIAYGVIQVFAPNGHPYPATSPELWAKLETDVLQREFPHEMGTTMPIRLMAIDTGYKPQLVYDYTAKHPQPMHNMATGLRIHAVRSVVPVKGTDEALQIIDSISKEDAARKRQNVRIIHIGTHAVKQELFDSLRYVKPDGANPVPNCCHFPEYEFTYFQGVCSEVRIEKGSKVTWEKKNNVRNEPLDCRVYARAAATICGLDRFTPRDWERLEASLGVKPVEKPVEIGQDIGQAPPAPVPVQPVAPQPQRAPQPQQRRPGRRVRGRFSF
jgi:phage terminase large subunit GpA-like protein